jgi:hypothetical protein
MWLALGLALSGRTLLSPDKHSVFPIFASSATHWWADQPLYCSYPNLDVFRYPPLFALTVTPFAALGFRWGGVLWGWLNLVVLLGGLWCFVSDVAPGRWTRSRIAAFMAVAALGALRGLWNNQSNALMVGLLLLGASALARAIGADGSVLDIGQRRRWWRAAVLLALPVCLKLTPVAPALLLCALWPRRLAWRFALAVLLGFLLPFLTRPPEVVVGHYAEWLNHLTHSGHDRWLGFRDGWTVWLAVRHLATGLRGALAVCQPVEGMVYPGVQLLSAVAALVWCLWQRQRADRLGLGAAWQVHVTLGVGMAWLMLFGPAVEHATYVFLAPALAWAVVQAEAWEGGRLLLGAAAALVLLLGWGAVSRQAMVAWPAAGPLLVAALPVGTALFALWLCGYASAAGQRPPRHAFLPDGERAMVRGRWLSSENPSAKTRQQQATIPP